MICFLLGVQIFLFVKKLLFVGSDGQTSGGMEFLISGGNQLFLTMKKKTKPDVVRDDRERNDAMNKSEDKGSQKLPGDYDAREDIMNRRDTDRVSIDEDNFSRTVGIENYNKPGAGVVSNPDDIQDNPAIEGEDPEEPPAREMKRPVPRDLRMDDEGAAAESDVTEEDLQALGPRDLSMNMGEDEAILKNRVWPVDMAASDLDVPGAELDDDMESIGNEDEENNSYSLGGDRHEDNLEGK